MSPIAQARTAPRGSAIYALDTGGEATSVQVFVSSSANVVSGLSTSSAILFGCAELTAVLPEGGTDITDVSCSYCLADWAGDDGTEVSLAELVGTPQQ